MHNNEIIPASNIDSHNLRILYPDGMTDEEIRKELILTITHIIHANEWRQVDAAQIIGVPQPRISNLMNMQFEKFSVDILVSILSNLGHKFRFLLLNDEHLSHEISETTIHHQGIRIINSYIKGNNWTQTRAASYLGLSQPRVSNLQNLCEDKFSLEIIMSLLVRIGYKLHLQYNLDEISDESKFTFIVAQS